jgi:invasion protein IalB
MAQGCFAGMPLSSDLLTALKRGKRLSISLQDMAKKDVVLPFPLNNFAQVFQKVQ